MLAADVSDNTGDKKQFFWTQPRKKPKNCQMQKEQTKYQRTTHCKRWDKRQRICSLVNEGDEEEEEEEDEMASAHTAFRLQQQQQRAKVRSVVLLTVHQHFVRFCLLCIRSLLYSRFCVLQLSLMHNGKCL